MVTKLVFELIYIVQLIRLGSFRRRISGMSENSNLLALNIFSRKDLKLELRRMVRRTLFRLTVAIKRPPKRAAYSSVRSF